MTYSLNDDIFLNVNNKNIGQSIRYFRELKNMSQEILAFESDLHFTYISSVERGKQNISIVNIIRICKTLGISVSALMESLICKLV